MPSKPSRTKTQVRKDRSALKKLFSTGILKSKPNLSRKPSAQQRKLINKYQDVIAGKATAVKPKNPKTYKGLFRVERDVVIVPRRKGEKITTNKKGEITGTRKVGGRTVKSRFRHVKKGEPIERPRGNMQYAIPFVRGGGEIQWMRFPNYDMLKQFMEGYNYKDWRSYVVTERPDDEGDDEALNEKLEAKLETLKERRRKQLLTPGKRSRK